MESDKPAQLTTPINQYHASQFKNPTVSQWQLKLELSNQCQQEYILSLSKNNSRKKLRSWFGPLALHLFLKAKHQINPTSDIKNQGDCLLFDKLFTQHFLIEASFYHQKCLMEFQVKNDLLSKGLSYDDQLGELLLYIRMTSQHPSYQTLLRVGNETTHNLKGIVSHIQTLKDNLLIQEIKHETYTFYDKNPLPHSHLYDPDKNIIFDYNHYIDPKAYQIIPA